MQQIHSNDCSCCGCGGGGCSPALQRMLSELEHGFAHTFCSASPRPLEAARAQLLVRLHEPIVGDL